MPKKNKPDRPRVKAIEERWTKPIADAGWTAIPNVLLDKQHALGLAPMDINIILQIAKHWWEPSSAPYPGVERLAEAIGVHVRTIQKHITKMEHAGLLEREAQFYSQGGQRSNRYTFQGLIDKCTPFATEAVAERKRKKAADRARIRRKAPLHVART